MDLGSGSLLFEEVAPDRPYATGDTRGKARLEGLGTGGLSLVSDRATALSKLADTGLDCLRIPAVFHRIHDLVKRDALAMASRLRQARQALRPAQECLATCQASDPSGAEVLRAQALVEAREAEVAHGEGRHSPSRHHRETVSRIRHPWRLVDSTPQTSPEVARQLHAEITALET
jgi:hypothetical protein